MDKPAKEFVRRYVERIKAGYDPTRTVAQRWAEEAYWGGLTQENLELVLDRCWDDFKDREPQFRPSAYRFFKEHQWLPYLEDDWQSATEEARLNRKLEAPEPEVVREPEQEGKPMTLKEVMERYGVTDWKQLGKKDRG